MRKILYRVHWSDMLTKQLCFLISFDFHPTYFQVKSYGCICSMRDVVRKRCMYLKFVVVSISIDFVIKLLIPQ